MLQYVIAILCFLWFIRVWICVVSAPYRFVRHTVKVTIRCFKTCSTKAQISNAFEKMKIDINT